MANRHVVFWALVVGIFVFDRLTKFLVVSFMSLGSSINLAPFVSLTYVMNTGTFFGLFKGAPMLFILLAFVVCLYIVWRYSSFKQIYVIPAALVFAGALGNLVDRLLYGGVIDFIDVGFWPVFNVADSAISIAVVLLVVREYVLTNQKI